MSRLFRDEALSILLEALRDERYIVRECAVAELDELDLPAFDAEVASHIRPLLDDSHPDVRSAARWYFAHMAGKCEPDEEVQSALRAPNSTLTALSFGLNRECREP